jgi:hypothetical protein
MKEMERTGKEVEGKERGGTERKKITDLDRKDGIKKWNGKEKEMGS